MLEKATLRDNIRTTAAETKTGLRPYAIKQVHIITPRTKPAYFPPAADR